MFDLIKEGFIKASTPAADVWTHSRFLNFLTKLSLKYFLGQLINAFAFSIFKFSFSISLSFKIKNLNFLHVFFNFKIKPLGKVPLSKRIMFFIY